MGVLGRFREVAATTACKNAQASSNAANHSVGILGDLPGDEDEVTGASGRIERQSRVFLSNQVYILLVAARVVHRPALIRMPWFH